ncbi:MAG: guanylate kinase [Eubacteriales bacterium]|nr:guanylate kinase [Eubacteriales bacterium]
MNRGMLIIVSGPSGVGKGTVCNALFAQDAKLTFSVSATTRAPRPGEKEGVSYFFISDAEFQRMVEQDAFLEYACNFNTSSYGTPKAYVEKMRDAGKDVVLDIDVKGAANVKKVCPDAITIFIAPPSMDALESRLRGRATENEEALQKRLREAVIEMDRIDEYEYLVVNDVLQTAVGDMHSIINAERLRTFRNVSLFNQLRGGR